MGLRRCFLVSNRRYSNSLPLSLSSLCVLCVSVVLSLLRITPQMIPNLYIRPPNRHNNHNLYNRRCMKGTPLTDQIVEYMIELFPAEDALLRELRSAAITAEIPAIQISPEQAAFMQVFLRAIGAKRVLEVGTLGGYSAISMARALPADGMVTTIELDPFRAEFARGWAKRAGLSSKIEVRVGAGVDVLERDLAGSGPYDFAFIDADKPNYVRYLDLILPMMRRGGVIAGDNALAWGEIANPNAQDPSVLGMQAFNRAMAARPELQCSLIPIGDGMCVGVVL